MCSQQADICLVIDSSGSIRDANPRDGSYDNWQLLLRFLAGLVDYFDVGLDDTRIGAVVFSDSASLEFPLDRHTNKDDLKDALRSITFLGQETNTPHALRVTRQECFSATRGDRPEVQNTVIIITDGVPYPPARRTPAIEEARRLQASGARIFAIGVTDVIDEQFLRALSSPPKTENVNFFTSMGFPVLNEISRVVGLGTCPSQVTGKRNFCSERDVGQDDD